MLKKQYRHLNKVLISRSALQHNHRILQEYHPEAKIVPVLKSNAYGHKLKIVAPIFDSLHPVFLVVDSLFEAYELRKIRVKSPVLILGYTHPDNFAVKQLPFHVAVFDLEVARSLNANQRNCNVHIFVDTGMCREGVPLSQLPDFMQQINKLTNLNVVGLASHLADADNTHDDSFTQLQLKNYKAAVAILEQAGVHTRYRHISASGGAFKIKDPVVTMIRAGLASYGINPLDSTDPAANRLDLLPALQFISTLAQIKTISKGDRVGYNGTFTAGRAMTIGLLPLGYYEGVDRRLSNKGVVTLGGVACPILGRVSMNMTTVDLSSISQLKVGDEVVVYSSDPTAPNSIVKASKTANTIPYELLVNIAESVRRKVV